MGKTEILEKVRKIALPVLGKLGYELVEVAMVVSHGRRTLRVFIHSKDGISVGDCAKASKALSAMLDGYDLFSRRYYLEVSSPGAERKLKTREDFGMFIGRKAHVRLREASAGMNKIEGRIEAFQGDVLRLQPEEGTAIDIPFGDILCARLCL